MIAGTTILHPALIRHALCGQWGAGGLEPAIVPKDTPCLGKRGVEAVDFVRGHPLDLSLEEARNLTHAKLSSEYATLAQGFDDAQAMMGSEVRFSDLPKEVQTVAFSVAMNHGPNLQKAAPRFWGDLLKQDWSAMEGELRHFYKNETKNASLHDRRIKEADYLRLHMTTR